MKQAPRLSIVWHHVPGVIEAGNMELDCGDSILMFLGYFVGSAGSHLSGLTVIQARRMTVYLIHCTFSHVHNLTVSPLPGFYSGTFLGGAGLI